MYRGKRRGNGRVDERERRRRFEKEGRTEDRGDKETGRRSEIKGEIKRGRDEDVRSVEKGRPRSRKR